MNNLSIRSLGASFILLLTLSCTPKSAKVLQGDDGKIDIALVQLNDVYEIGGVDGGKQGDLSRAAYYTQQIRKKYPNTLLLMAGDFLNPSLINTMKYEGERIRGKQMIEVLNAMDLDLAAFGNHEFDFDLEDLQKRIDESEFDWIATNLHRVTPEGKGPFIKQSEGKKDQIPGTKSYTFTDSDGTTIKLGFFSATIASNPRDYVAYYDADSCAALAIDHLKEKHDVIVGLTHLSMGEDIALAKKEQEVDLILGGHEHDHRFEQVGHVPIAKADANARTLYVHILSYDTRKKEATVKSELIPINTTVPQAPEVLTVIEKWNKILADKITQVVADPYEVVYQTNQVLDGRESSIRHHQGLMGDLFTKAMLKSSRIDAELALLNSGSIRIDDQLSGDILGIDIFRTLPFGGAIWEAEIKGSLLAGIMRFSENHKGTGAYLLYTGLKKSGDEWLINGVPLDQNKYYKVAINDFLLMGFDIPFLKEDNAGIKKVYKPKSGDKTDKRLDIRAGIIDYLKGL